MHNNSTEDLERQIADRLIEASSTLEPSLVEALQKMKSAYENLVKQQDIRDGRRNQLLSSLQVLTMIEENLKIAGQDKVPMCQDTGMFVVFTDIGPQCPYTMSELEQIITGGIQKAVPGGYFRHSIVEDPLFHRTNTGTNLPYVIHWSTCEHGAGSLRFLLKGFGSENCSASRMLSPTTSPDAFIEEVTRMVIEAGGKPCPPIVVGVGVGSTAEMSGVLAKRALLREVGLHHSDEEYKNLEERLLNSIQKTEIGPGGFGGPLTALWVAVEHMGTHIAGLPVSVAISCWADRKARVEL